MAKDEKEISEEGTEDQGASPVEKDPTEEGTSEEVVEEGTEADPPKDPPKEEDFETKNKELQTRIGQAEHTIEVEKDKHKVTKKENEDLVNVISGIPSLVKQAVKEEMNQSGVDAKIRALTNSPAEATYVRTVYDTLVKHTGDLDFDLSNAISIALKDRNKKTAEEIAKANQSASLKSQGGGEGSEKIPSKKKYPRPKTEPWEDAWIKRSGLVWNSEKGIWDKPAPVKPAPAK